MEMFSSLKTFLPYLPTGGYGYYRAGRGVCGWGGFTALRELVKFSSNVELRSQLPWLPMIPRGTVTESCSEFSHKTPGFYLGFIVLNIKMV